MVRRPHRPHKTHRGELDARAQSALFYAADNAMYDGDHHKMWVIDQMVRALTGCPMITKTAVNANGQTYRYEAQGESAEYLRVFGPHPGLG